MNSELKYKNFDSNCVRRRTYRSISNKIVAVHIAYFPFRPFMSYSMVTFSTEMTFLQRKFEVHELFFGIL